MKKIIFSGGFVGRGFRLPDIRKNLLLWSMLASLFAGVATGAFHGRNADAEMLQSLDLLFLTDFRAGRTQTLHGAFAASFASAFIFMLMIFLSGMSLWGVVSAAVVPFIKGYGYGLSVGFLYSAYGLSGIGYNALVILPGAMLCSVVIASAARQAILCSAKILTLFRKTAVSDDPRVFMRHYLLAMLWLLLLAAVSSLIDMIFTAAFSQLFNFG